MKKSIFLVLFFMFEVFITAAQTGIVITNKVIDAKSKHPLVFAHVYDKKLSTGTFTDKNGYFTLIIPKSHINDTLTFSFVGYKTLNLEITEIKDTVILLTPKTNMLKEVTIVARYNPKKIFRKVRKNLKKNYPLDDPYCAKTFSREYLKKDTQTVEMFEANITVKEKGIKIKYCYDSEFDIDTINYLYRSDYNFYWGDFMFMLLYFDQPSAPRRGRFSIDSVFFMNNEKYISITYIPKKSDTIGYDTYESIETQNGKTVNLPIAHKIIKTPKSHQYSYIAHYIINLEDFAITRYSSSYNLLGKPIRLFLKINKEYEKSSKMFVSYEKINGKYYVKKINREEQTVFVSKLNIDKKLYTLKSYREFYFRNVKTNCINTTLTPYLWLDPDEFIEKYKNKIYPFTI